MRSDPTAAFGLSRLLLLSLVSALALGACSPIFNWRESRLGDTALLAMMPCKPETHARDVPFVHGAVTRMTVASCETGGLTFALTTADVGETALAAKSLVVWREVVGKHWGLKPGAQLSPLNLAKADAGAVRLRATGQQAQQEMAVDAAFFATGSQLYQVAVIAKPPKGLTGEISETFFGGIKLQ
ncbi:MAG: hypothetical protein RLZZ271_568 [Pseudomonadota bacterium]|jgi:hypothetical protein